MCEWVILNQDITSLSKGHPLSLKDDGACSGAIGATSKIYVLKVTDKPKSECAQYFAAEYDFTTDPKTMVRQRKAKVFIPPNNVLVDNGVMIAWNGYLRYKQKKQVIPSKATIYPYERTDQID